MKQPNWRDLFIPGHALPVFFAYGFGANPHICLRSLLAVLRLRWQRWRSLCAQTCEHNDWPLTDAWDYRMRATMLLDARQVPQFLAMLAPQVVLHYPAGGSRLAALAEQWPTDLTRNAEKSADRARIKAANSEQHPIPHEPPSARAHAAYVLRPKKPAVTITREVEAEVLSLTAQGMGRSAIGRRLGISTPSVSLLANGKYRFSAAEAARPRLADESVMVSVRTGRPSSINAAVGQCVLNLRAQGFSQAEIVRRLSIGASTVRQLVNGKYCFAQNAMPGNGDDA